MSEHRALLFSLLSFPFLFLSVTNPLFDHLACIFRIYDPTSLFLLPCAILLQGLSMFYYFHMLKMLI